MTKKLFKLFIVLMLAASLYAMTAHAQGDSDPKPTQTTQPKRPATSTANPGACEVITGVDAGTVNLRACAGTTCKVLDIVTEGERLTILTAGNWTQVTNADGVTGWLNSKYCKGK